MNQIEQEYKAIIIGTGQGGSPLARELANAGWKTAVIESHYVGGSCINYGCTPTKTMVASARVAYLARRAGDYGVSASEISVELKKVKQRKQDIVESFRNSGKRRLETTENLDLYFGRGRFLNSQDIEIKLNSGKKKLIRGKYIVINTGTETFIPDIPGLQSVDHLTSTSIMELEKVPEHLLIMGGGYIGLEFGQMFRRFGSQVTIIQRGSQLLSREDRDVAEEIATILQEDGIQVLLEADIKQVEQLNPSRIILKIHRNGKSEKVEGTHLLVAVGRRPATKSLGLENTGIDLDRRGNIRVNERLETSQEQVYAIGDVKGGPAFTHISYDDYRILRDRLLHGKNNTTSGRMVPYVVFTDPQLGRVGLSEKEAQQQGYDYKVAKMPMSHVARTLEVDETRGFMKVLVNNQNEHILGCAILGLEGGELMSMLQIAMMGNLPYTRLKDGIFAHPTLAESLNNLFISWV